MPDLICINKVTVIEKITRIGYTRKFRIVLADTTDKSQIELCSVSIMSKCVSCGRAASCEKSKIFNFNSTVFGPRYRLKLNGHY